MNAAEITGGRDYADDTDWAVETEESAAPDEPVANAPASVAAEAKNPKQRVFDEARASLFHQRIQEAYGEEVLSAKVDPDEVIALIDMYNRAHRAPLKKGVSTNMLYLALCGYTNLQISNMTGCRPHAATHLMRNSAPNIIARGLRETLQGSGIVERVLAEPEDSSDSDLGSPTLIIPTLQKRLRRPTGSPVRIRKPRQPERAANPTRSRSEIAGDIAESCDFDDDEKSGLERFIDPSIAAYEAEPSQLSAINKIMKRLEARPDVDGVWYLGLNLRDDERARLESLLGNVYDPWKGVLVPPTSLNEQQQLSRLNGLPPADDTKYLYSGLEQIISILKEEHPDDA